MHNLESNPALERQRERWCLAGLGLLFAALTV